MAGKADTEVVLVYLLMLVAYATLWILSTSLCKSRRALSVWENPYSWFVPVWIIQAIVLMAPLLDYENPVSGKTAAYIIACHFAFVSGAALVLFSRSTVRAPANGAGKRGVVVPLVLLIGLTADSLLLIDSVVSSGIGVAERFGSSQALSDFREARLNGNPMIGFLGPAFGPITILAAFSLIGIAYLGFSWGVRDRWSRLNRPGGLFGLVALLLSGFLTVASSGGRIDLVFVIALISIPFALGRSLTNPFGAPVARQLKRLVLVTPIAIALFMTSAWYQSFRGEERPPEQDLHLTFRAEIPAGLREANAQNNVIGYNLMQAAYIGHSLTVLEYFHIFGTAGPFYGRYNFPNEMRLVLRLLPNYDPDFWTHDRFYLFRTLESQGRLGNVWGSIIHDFEADFGYYGAIAAFFAFGASMQSITTSYYKRPSANRAALLGVLRLVCLWSALSSLFFLTKIGWVVFILLVVELFFAFVRSFSGRTTTLRLDGDPNRFERGQ